MVPRLDRRFAQRVGRIALSVLAVALLRRWAFARNSSRDVEPLV
ncbi:MAG: hypothetical protein KatS3mg008_0132 [Acidimicrobiales bacterium]|nr:MAG: hypothetical protein KatS3mg008_0132 [Acidimicrobiales bacterium]